MATVLSCVSHGHKSMKLDELHSVAPLDAPANGSLSEAPSPIIRLGISLRKFYSSVDPMSFVS